MKLNSHAILALQQSPEEFYDEIVVPSGLFEKAGELFPYYNSTQCVEATEYIIDHIEQNFGLANNPIWLDRRDDIYEMIVAGLT
jgi:hypothetical protein